VLLAAAGQWLAHRVVAARDDHLVVDTRDARQLAGHLAAGHDRLLGNREWDQVGLGDPSKRDVDAGQRRRLVHGDDRLLDGETVGMLDHHVQRWIVAARPDDEAQQRYHPEAAHPSQPKVSSRACHLIGAR
jgi:hypothetical protein